ncbi:zf-TFIIB domain-containing protein, partial [Pseudogemmobacter humi]|uniref:TFIIB-type zinc ribbon-containing protein n=1 Tax=Pseudogemmobacter humi TaxID=2483812 RepID=UPI0018EF9514
MKCPVDNETLMMTERQGVEIDYCPRCRGIWLDRGELDKLIEKASQQAMPPVSQPEPAPVRSAAPPPPPP